LRGQVDAIERDAHLVHILNGEAVLEIVHETASSGKARISASKVARVGASSKIFRPPAPSSALRSSRGVRDQKASACSRRTPKPKAIASRQGKGGGEGAAARGRTSAFRRPAAPEGFVGRPPGSR